MSTSPDKLPMKLSPPEAAPAGLKTVLVPKDNVRDLELLPEHVRTDLEIVPVSTMDEVLAMALVGSCRPKVLAKQKLPKPAAPSKRKPAR